MAAFVFSPPHVLLSAPETNFQDSIIIIRGPRGAGTGFVGRLANTNYLFTNEHVLRCGRPLSCQALSGRELRLGSLEVADDRDLVRFLLLDQSIPSLQCATNNPQIGEPVSVLGNSDAGSVITRLDGKLLGVGPDVVETDAPFVRGNSGSPLILRSGEVCAVASYVTRSAQSSDWVKRDTRFAQIRRFGIRLNAVPWISISDADYGIRAETLSEIEAYVQDVCEIVFDLARVSTTGYVTMDFEALQRKYQRNPALFKSLTAILVYQSNFIRSRDRVRRNNLELQQRRGVDHQLNARVLADSGQMATDKDRLIQAVNDSFSLPLKPLKENPWKILRLKEEALYWHELIRSLSTAPRPSP